MEVDWNIVLEMFTADQESASLGVNDWYGLVQCASLLRTIVAACVATLALSDIDAGLMRLEMVPAVWVVFGSAWIDAVAYPLLGKHDGAVARRLAVGV